MHSIPLFLLALVLALPLPALAQAPTPVVLRHLDLAGPAASSHSQLSGLAWHGEDLLLLPQYPDFKPDPRKDTSANRPSPRLFALQRSNIVDALGSRGQTFLTPREIAVQGPDFREIIPGYEGFEAIAVSGDQAYLLIESRPDPSKPAMRGYLVRGAFQGDSLVLDDDLIPLTPPVALANMCFESIFVLDGAVWILFEANGDNVNPNPQALRYSLDGEPLPPASFPHVEYRITDTTAVDDSGGFWSVNFYWPGEKKLLQPAEDPIAARWGSRTDGGGDQEVERLLRCIVTQPESGSATVSLADAPPVDLDLSLLPSNWEGVASLAYEADGRLVRGVLLVTDTYPITRFVFAPLASWTEAR